MRRREFWYVFMDVSEEHALGMLRDYATLRRRQRSPPNSSNICLTTQRHIPEESILQRFIWLRRGRSFGLLWTQRWTDTLYKELVYLYHLSDCWLRSLQLFNEPETSLKNVAFWVIQTCSSERTWRFGRIYRLHSQGRRVRKQERKRNRR
jgi:hypothetical protein